MAQTSREKWKQNEIDYKSDRNLVLNEINYSEIII